MAGRISVGTHGLSVVFRELSAAYPLKLLSPRSQQPRVGVVYLITYGGGLVGGDQISLHTDIASSAILVLLSQGTTKVFKTRPGIRLAAFQNEIDTSQTFHFTVADSSALFLLPEPVQPYQSASYNQSQRFDLSVDASLILLDWVTSGRPALGEDWLFSKYYSLNEIFVDGKLIAKDVLLLENGTSSPRQLADRMRPYNCYATLFLHGPLLAPAIQGLLQQYSMISVMKMVHPTSLLWSLSSLGPRTVMLRIAGLDTEMVQAWIRRMLAPVEPLIGSGTYKRAFGS